MPQIEKGGKFIFGISVVQDNFSVCFPPQAIKEYNIISEGKIYLFTGSKKTGGFCVTRKGLLEPSKLAHILLENPDLRHYKLHPGSFIKYKGRSYCWLPITEKGIIQLTSDMLHFLDLHPRTELLSIRSSDIAFTMGAKGPLLEKARNYEGVIEHY